APDSASAYHNLGTALINLNRHSEAIACYQRSIGLKPDSAAAYSNLGLTLEELGRRSEAREAFEKAFELDPENIGFHYTMMDSTRFAAADPRLATLERLADA